MLDRAICLVVKKAGNYELVSFNIENENDKENKYTFTPTNSLTCIAIWPHKDEQNELDDVKKQVCLKLIELRNMTYAMDLREKSSVKAIMDMLDETERDYVDAIMQEYEANRHNKVTNIGTAFSSDLIAINLPAHIKTPAGIVAVNEEEVNEVAFRHAGLERLKEVVRPALLADYNNDVRKVNGLLRTLNAEPTQAEISGTNTLFHPFALQLNTMLNKRKEEADKVAEESAVEFKNQHEVIRQQSKNSTTLFTTDYFTDLKKAHEPICKQLDAKLLSNRNTAKLSI